PDGRLHYVDEGSGPILLFVHGTPEWSFAFRHLIKAFRATHRCIAIDHLDFGLSDKPMYADYSVAAHARRFQRFVDHLGLRNVTVIVMDFGGGIGLQHVLDHPENVAGVVLCDTWMWPLHEDPRFARPARIARSWLGRQLYLRFGFSVNVMMPSAYGDRKKLTGTAHAHYRNALPDARSRLATHAFAKEILDAGPFWARQWERVERLREIPALVCWGLKDRFLPADLLERWRQALPTAMVRTFPNAGHFLQEEAPGELAQAIRAFLEGHQ
ncbi:MAG TPA: alpha/beta fold hydrolase, partial [Flavobacteriales bacterium]|nr:alpha/beta fold hydrolase [Flavobacteriales bacterium]